MGQIILKAIEGIITAQNLVVFCVIGVVVWWLRGLREDRKNFKEFMKDIGKKIEDMKSKVDELWGRWRSVSTGNSPVVLTKLGLQVAKEIEIEDWAGSFVEQLHRDLKDKENPYEMQELCFEFAKGKFIELQKAESSSLMRKMELSAYNNGIPFEQVLEVVGIVLRNKLMEKCGIDPPDDLPIPPEHLSSA